MRAIWACRSDVGIKRQINEDNFKANPAELFFVVADGMGGHAGGELASRLVVECMDQFITTTRAGTTAPLPFAPRADLTPEANRLYVAIRAANREVYDTAVHNPALAGMGSTAVAILGHGRDLHLAHVGDSRCYLLRGDKLSQVTRDHSYVNELIDGGQLDPDTAYRHTERNIITRAMGSTPDVEPDVTTLRIKNEDLFLLCSDGLTDKASDRKLFELMQPLVQSSGLPDGSLDDARQRLDKVLQVMIKYANGRGGDDNITALLVQFRE
ncbi:MAG: PP2C family serine/threonine-protein phosphatase [Pseudomonadota bacterium]